MTSTFMQRAMRVVSLLSCLQLAVVETHADMLPPPQPRNASPFVRFVGIDARADWAFLLAVRTSDRGPGVRRIVEVADDGWCDPGILARIHEFTLMAIPRKVYDGLDADARRNLDPQDPRFIASEIPPPWSISYSWGIGERPRYAYIVDFRDGRLVIRWSDDLTDARGRPGEALHFFGGLALAVAAVISGGLYASRVFREGRRPGRSTLVP